MSRAGLLLGALLLCCSPAVEPSGRTSPVVVDRTSGVDGAEPPQSEPTEADEAPVDQDAAPEEETAEAEETAPPPPPPIVIPAEEYALATKAIEDPSGSMEHFYRRLELVARRREGVLARVAVYSDSINGSDAVTSAIRGLFQKRFGDGGKGFLPVAPGWPTQYHRDVEWEHHRGWFTYVVNRGRSPGDRYGLGGVMAYNRSQHSKASFGTVDEGEVGRGVSRFRLFYQAWPQGGAVELTVDEGEPHVVRTQSEAVEDRVETVEVEDGAHTLEVAVREGRLRLYGVVMERPGPGVVVDGLMLIGARGRRLALFDGEHLGRQVALRELDLLVFWMGGNDAESEYFDREGFLADYGAGIAHARAGRPEASCLIVSIPDLGVSPGGSTRRRVPEIVEAQQELALAQGCAFYNFFEAMGGAGSIRRWYRSSPRLVSADYTHPTAAGAQRMGEYFYQTVLRGFAESLPSADPDEEAEGD